MCISHHGCEKYSNLWCQIRGKWNCEAKNVKQTLLLPQGKTLSTVPIIAPKEKTDYSFPPVKGEDYENQVNFFKICTIRCLINGARHLLIFQFFYDPTPLPPLPSPIELRDFSAVFDTLLIITLFLLASLLVCLLSLKLSISIKHLCLFFPFITHINEYIKISNPLPPFIKFNEDIQPFRLF